MAIVINSKTKLTYGDYALIPSDGKRHEIIDGEHVVTPTAETYHQTVSRRVQFQLYRQIEEPGQGEVFNAPTDLQLSEVDIVQPDLIVVLTAKKSIITRTRIKGIPDLVVEITSKDSAKRDRLLKKELYQKAGIPEYWILDPKNRVVEQYVLKEGVYSLVGKHRAEISFQQLPGVKVDLTKVW